MEELHKKMIGRRDFLSFLAMGSVVATVTTSTTEVTMAQETRSDKSKARYRVTDDIKAFYRVNRYPAARKE